MQAGEESRRELTERGVEHESAVSRVMMRDEHHRAISIAITRLRDHVPGGALGKQSAAKPASSVSEVVPQRRRSGARGQCGREAAGPAAAGKRQRPAPEREQVGQADRPPVAAVRPLLLDGRVATPPAQARGDPLGSASLAR